MLVKASTAFGVLGIAVWVAMKRRRDAARFLVVAAATTVAGYVPVGRAALASVTVAAGRTSRASVWSPISRASPRAAEIAALVAVLGLAAGGAYRFRAYPSSAPAAAGVVAAYLVAGAYVLPWYPAWALPSVALARRSWLAVFIAVHAAFLVATYDLPRTAVSGTVGAWSSGVFVVGFASVFFTAFATALFRPSLLGPVLVNPQS